MYKDSDVRVIESKTVGGKIIRKFKDTRADKNTIRLSRQDEDTNFI